MGDAGDAGDAIRTREDAAEDAILRVQLMDPGPGKGYDVDEEDATAESQRSAARLRGWSLYMGRAAAAHWGGHSQGFCSASMEAPSLGEVPCGAAVGLLPAWAQSRYPLTLEACAEVEVITIAWNHVHGVLPSAALRATLRAEVRTAS